ncbi:major facilitator superfamily domain-containing protein [Limtongia smithiae]|uniref:major facilitator superfamily domain-containing protein n=1 Tax=Limtongia smithiae TaxID=1125753 RepID=UPI0034CF7EA7
MSDGLGVVRLTKFFSTPTTQRPSTYILCRAACHAVACSAPSSLPFLRPPCRDPAAMSYLTFPSSVGSATNTLGSGDARRYSTGALDRPLLDGEEDADELDDELRPLFRAHTSHDYRQEYPYWKVDDNEEETEELHRFRTTSTYATYNHYIYTHASERATYSADVGYRPWLAALGGFCAQFCSFGYMNVIGVFQAYYESHQLADLSPSTIAWIGSIQTFILAVGGLVAGRICDMYGPRVLTIPGCVLLTVGVFTTASCTSYYQFVLAQGVCSALGASALFYATTAAISTWFDVRRGLAFGVAASGASFGGIALPFMFDALSSSVSFEAAVYAMAAMLFFFSALTALVTTTRIPPSGRQPYRFVHFYIRPYMDPVFSLVTFSLTLTYLGLFVPFAFIATHAVSSGLSLRSAFHLVAFLNAGSFAGRLFSGIASDRIGKFSVFFFVTLLSGLIAFPLWYLSESEGVIVLVSIAYGFASGGVLAMYPALVAQISPVTEIGTRLGSLSAAIAFAALASLPVAGAIVGSDATAPNFGGMQIYAGVAMLGGAGIALLAKAHATRGNIFARE